MSTCEDGGESEEDVEANVEDAAGEAARLGGVRPDEEGRGVASEPVSSEAPVRETELPADDGRELWGCCWASMTSLPSCSTQMDIVGRCAGSWCQHAAMRPPRASMSRHA